MVFNIFAPLKRNRTSARRVLNAILPADIKTVTGVHFESSPGRGDPLYIGDHTAFDVVVTYIAKDGAKCFLGIVVKYAEASPASPSPVKPHSLRSRSCRKSISTPTPGRYSAHRCGNSTPSTRCATRWSTSAGISTEADSSSSRRK